MTQVIVNLGTGGSDLNGRSGSTTGADSNDPKFLAWEGENYVYLPGVTGNYLSAPDEAALDITGDIDVRAYLALDDWTPAAEEAIITKRESNTQRSFQLHIRSNGGLRFFWSENGSTYLDEVSTEVLSVNDGEAIWVRVTLDVDNGASGNDVKFYTSTDGVSWSQLGSTLTNAGTTSIYSSTSQVEIGSSSGGAIILPAGKYYRAQIFDGIEEDGGTKALDVDTSLVDSGSDTSFTALTGQTVSINRSTSGRKSVAVTHPLWLFGTDDYMVVNDSDLLDFGASDSFTVLAVVRRFGTSSFGIFKAGAQTGSTAGWVIYNDSRRLRDGTNTVSDSAPAIVAGDSSLVALVVDRSTNQLTSYTNDSASTPISISSVGDSSNANSLFVGGVSNTGDMEFVAAAVWRKALTAGEIATLTNYYQGRVA